MVYMCLQHFTVCFSFSTVAFSRIHKTTIMCSVYSRKCCRGAWGGHVDNGIVTPCILTCLRPKSTRILDVKQLRKCFNPLNSAIPPLSFHYKYVLPTASNFHKALCHSIVIYNWLIDSERIFPASFRNGELHNYEMICSTLRLDDFICFKTTR